MKSILQKYSSTSLILRIVIGLIIGACLGILVPGASAIGILGTLFVGALKAIAPILVFILIIASLARANTGMGKQFGTVIGLYVF
ncbi:MAG: serine/threonine transporter SstT, partial [Firmicutes bacterium]|nr:serine/threonine transporter SstT [Bacillota bacterium]